MDVALSRAGPRGPGLGDERDLVVAQLRQAACVARRMDYDLLALKSRVEVRDDPHLPTGRVGLAAAGGEREDLRWRPILSAFAKRTRLQLGRICRLDPGCVGAWPLAASWSNGHEAPRERVDPQLSAQEPDFVRSRNGVSRSIGAGKTIVVDC